MKSLQDLVFQPAGEQRRSLLPWLLVLFLGAAALAAWFLISPALTGTRYYKVGYNRTAYEFNKPILWLFVPYGLALLAWWRGARAPLWILFGGAVVLHLMVLFAPLPQSQDFYQYLFYGRIQVAHGANPYLVHPAQFWADPWFPWIRWVNQPSVYGPVWMLVSAGVVKVVGRNLAEGFVLLKLVILTLDLSIMAMIVKLARTRSDSPEAGGWGLLAYAWNPLILITVPLGGSSDVVLAAGFLGALLARRKGMTWVATILLTLATLVKAYAGVALLLHLVLVWKEEGRRATFRNVEIAAGLSVLAYAPYWAGLATFKGLFGAVELNNQSLVGMLQRLLAAGLSSLGLPSAGPSAVIVRVAGTAGLVAALAWAVRHVKDQDTLWYGVLVALVAYLYLTPWFLYWYMLAPLALVAALPRNRLTVPILVFSATAMFLMITHPPNAGLALQTILRYAPAALTFAFYRPGRVRATRLGGVALDFPFPATASTVRSASPAK
jgi:hypothetical protein